MPQSKGKIEYSNTDELVANFKGRHKGQKQPKRLESKNNISSSWISSYHLWGENKQSTELSQERKLPVHTCTRGSVLTRHVLCTGGFQEDNNGLCQYIFASSFKSRPIPHKYNSRREGKTETRNTLFLTQRLIKLRHVTSLNTVLYPVSISTVTHSKQLAMLKPINEKRAHDLTICCCWLNRGP